MTTCDPHDHDALRRKHAALRRLAASLVAVPEDADDVVQDTWLAALSRRADSIRNLDGWLHRVARYQAAHRRRKDAVRRERERRVARAIELTEPEGSSPPARLMDAVGALREPYRSVIRMRFEEALPPEVIAQRLERPLTTIKSQLHRGLKQIRARLADSEERDTRRWYWAWLPGSSSWRVRASPRGLLACSAGLATACLLLVYSLIGQEQRDVPSAPGSASVARTDEVFIEAPSLGQDTPSRVPAKEAARSTAAAPAPTRSMTILGTVVDPAGQPVPEARVWVGQPGSLGDAHYVARSGRDGRFRLEDVARDAWISAEGDGWLRSGWASLRAVTARSSAETELTLRMTPTPSRIFGVVRDDFGLPIAGARIRFDEDKSEPWLHHGGWRFPGAQPGPTSAADGSFELDMHHHFSQWLLVTAAGHAPALTGVSSWGKPRVPVEVRLTRGETLSGWATFSSRQPAANARVTFQPDALLPAASTRTRSDGSFDLPHLPAGPGTLVIVSEDDLALSYRGRVDTSQEKRPVRVVLADEWTVAGTATDVRGRPLAGWTVVATLDEQRPALLELFESRPSARLCRRTDARGRFAFGGLPSDVGHRVHLLAPGAQHVPRATSLAPTLAGGPPVLLQAADELSRLTGAVQLESVEERRSCELVARSPALLQDRFATVDADTGAFALEDVLPGEYELYLWERDGAPVPLGRFALYRGALDVGRIHVPEKATLQLCIRGPEGVPVEPRVLNLRSLEGYGTLQALPEMERTSPGAVTSKPIRKGRYQLLVKAPGYADFWSIVELERPGQLVNVDLERGAFVVVWVEAPQPFASGEVIRLRAVDVQDPSIEFKTTFSPRVNPARMTWNLPLGTYRVHASGESGVEASALLEVTARADDMGHQVRIALPPAPAPRAGVPR